MSFIEGRPGVRLLRQSGSPGWSPGTLSDHLVSGTSTYSLDNTRDCGSGQCHHPSTRPETGFCEGDRLGGALALVTAGKALT